ncbi:hypothetical protein C6P42_000312 [Pichia californica]|nr:hypothetical protein C6P42_000312 [[Candida] californica]
MVGPPPNNFNKRYTFFVVIEKFLEIFAAESNRKISPNSVSSKLYGLLTRIFTLWISSNEDLTDCAKSSVIIELLKFLNLLSSNYDGLLADTPELMHEPEARSEETQAAVKDAYKRANLRLELTPA